MNKENLIFIVADLIDQGYKEDFKIKCNILYATEAKKGLKMEDFDIDLSYKIIESSEAEDGDVQRLFAITSKDKTLKGLLIDSLNRVENIDSESIQHKFQENSETKVIVDQESALKYNLRKITKNIYLENPERFSLRKGFPDFPRCPFGNSFEALGWDKEKKEYVWLVTSVIKDKSLKVENYNEEN